MLTGRGTEYCGKLETHDYQLYLGINGIEHTKTKNQGDVTQEEIISGAGVDKSTVSRALSAMERRGWLTRRLDPSDTRRKILSLTNEADALKKDSLQAVQSTLAQALRGIDPEECAICLKVLDLVKSNLQNTAK